MRFALMMLAAGAEFQPPVLKADPELERDLLARVPPEVLPEGRHELETMCRKLARDLSEMSSYRGREGVAQEVRDLLGQRAHRLREVLDAIDLRLRDLDQVVGMGATPGVITTSAPAGGLVFVTGAERPQVAPPAEPAPPLPPEPSKALAVACPACKAAPGEGCRPGRSLTTTHKERVIRWRKEKR